MSEIQDRILSSEMEWPIFITRNGDRAPHRLGDGDNDREKLEDLVSEPLPRGIKSRSGMTSNGARFYVDYNQWPEYAAPEDTSPEGFVTNEIAGERIVFESVANLMRKYEDIETASIRKRVVSNNFEINGAGIITWGYHINLSADKAALQVPGASMFRGMNLLALHLATASPLLGSGALVADHAKNYHYSFSQKGLSIGQDFSHDTTSTAKPLINERDESHTCEGDKIARIHITCMDPSISPWAAKITLGTASLVLRAIEQHKGRDLALSAGSTGGIVELQHQTAHDLSMTSKTIMSDERKLTALEIQKELIAIVETTDHTDNEAAILAEWKQAVSDLEQDMERLSDRSDAIAKLTQLRAYADKKNLPQDDFSDKRLRALDIMYDTIGHITREDIETDNATIQSQQSLLPHRMRNTRFKAHMPSEEAIETAMTKPPTTTRANVRGYAINNYENLMNVYWDSFTIDNGGTVGTKKLPDPFASSLDILKEPLEPYETPEYGPEEEY